VVAGAPLALLATLPVKAIAAAQRAAGLPGAVSHSAGAYVCNHLFYALMHHLNAAPQPAPRGGFMHVGGGVALDAMVAGTRIAFEVSLQRSDDLAQAAGAIA
jgi:pyroglutamyl-peptidase